MISDVLKRIQWLGHDGFAITAEDGTRLVIDPYQIEACEPADLILITHQIGRASCRERV